MQITLQELNMTYPNGKKALQGVSGPTRPAWAICLRTSVCLTS